MIAVESLMASASTRERNERKGDIGVGYRCLLCENPVREDRAVWVHRHDDGGCWIVSEEEAARMDSRADLGMQPIGAECARRWRSALSPYIGGAA